MIYDGILAGAAAFNRTHLHMAGLASWQNTHASPGRFIQPGQMTLINKAVLAQCVGETLQRVAALDRYERYAERRRRRAGSKL